jgi:hypothetical protein
LKEHPFPGAESFPRKKALIIIFTVFFTLFVPLVLLLVYIAVFTDIGLGLRKTEDTQVKQAVISEEKERKDREQEEFGE